MDTEVVVKVINALERYRDSTNRVASTAKELGLTELEVREIISGWSIYEKRPDK